MGDKRKTILGMAWKVLKVLALVMVVLGAPGGWVAGAFVYFTIERPLAEVTQKSADHDWDQSQDPILMTDLKLGKPKFIRNLGGGLNEYEVLVSLKLENQSQVTIRTSAVVFDFYYGVLPDDVLSSDQSIRPFGKPDYRWGKQHGEYGAIKWEPIGPSWGGLNDDLKRARRKEFDIDDVKLVRNSFGASDFLPGHTTHFSEWFRFKAPPGSILGVWVCGRNSGGSGGWRWHEWRRRPLDE